MEHRRDIHGHVVYGEDDAHLGLNYLDYDLDREETEPLFKQAKLHGAVPFEDEHEHQFLLAYDSGRGAYTVTVR